MNEIEREEFRKELEKKHGCYIWVSRDGSFHPITQMNIYHLSNCYRLICRSILEHEYAYRIIDHPFWGLNPDSMAYDAATSESEYYDEFIAPILENLKAIFQAEFERRGEPFPSIKPIKKLPEVVEISGGIARLATEE